MSQTSSTKASVLFVCLGNICRSPMAEGALRAAAEEAGLDIEVDSVGTASYHVGEPPDPRAIATAQRHGVDIADARGRQLSEADFRRFTHILAMDRANIAGIKARAPRNTEATIALLLDLVEGREGEPVADPYYGDEYNFEQCWQTIQIGIAALIEELRQFSHARR